jgi:hypothetical protein
MRRKRPEFMCRSTIVLCSYETRFEANRAIPFDRNTKLPPTNSTIRVNCDSAAICPGPCTIYGQFDSKNSCLVTAETSDQPGTSSVEC